MNKPTFSIVIPVRDGAYYLEYCLNSLLNQTYQNFEIIIFDNNSTDDTLKKTKFYQRKFEQKGICFQTIESSKNYFVGGAFNRAFSKTTGKYIMLLCVDVILKDDFLEQALNVFKTKPKFAAIQAKVYSFDIKKVRRKLSFKFKISHSRVIDTCGFKVFPSRRIINIGHGHRDYGQFEKEMEIFGVEGACPVFRRKVLEEVSLNLGNNREIFDEDMVWYGDDFDLAWRINLFGWKQLFCPKLVAFHDRKTTKTLSISLGHFIVLRRSLPANKKILDYRNTRLALIKNESWQYFKRHLLIFLKRELGLLGYFFVFEPKTFWFGIFGFLKLFPRIYYKRKLIQKKVSPQNLEYIYQNLIRD